MWFQVNGKPVYDVLLPMAYEETPTLTKAWALSLAEQQHELYAEHIASKRVIATNFTILQSLKVELDFILDDDVKRQRRRLARVEQNRISGQQFD